MNGLGVSNVNTGYIPLHVFESRSFDLKFSILDLPIDGSIGPRKESILEDELQRGLLSLFAFNKGII